MNRERLSKVLRFVALVLLLAFPVNVAIDWHTYSTTLNSAPFWVFVLVNALVLLLPSGILGGIAWYLTKK